MFSTPTLLAMYVGKGHCLCPHHWGQVAAQAFPQSSIPPVDAHQHPSSYVVWGGGGVKHLKGQHSNQGQSLVFRKMHQDIPFRFIVVLLHMLEMIFIQQEDEC